MADADEHFSASSASSSFSEGASPVADVVYPIGVETEVPLTDGGLFKTVLVEGSGTKPLNGSKVTVHYVGTLASDGSEFDSSRGRGDPFVFTLGRGQVIKGWDKGVATMRIGEKAVLKCAPEYAYGASGSPPKIPANAVLLFEVELLDWTKEEDISVKKDRTLMKRVEIEGVDYESPCYEACLVADVTAFAGSKDERKQLFSKPDWEIEIGETVLPPYLEECLSSMKRKESSLFTVSGDIVTECKEFGISAGTKLTYVVEIHRLETIKSWKFSGIDKVNEGNKRKDLGNEAFKNGDLVRAERKYRRALEFVETDYGFDDEAKAAATVSRVACWGNLAQVLLLKKDYKEAVVMCDKALGADSKNTKARFRKAKALHLLSEWEAARQEVQRILEKDSTNADAKALLCDIQAAQRAYDQKQKSVFKKMFA